MNMYLSRTTFIVSLAAAIATAVPATAGLVITFEESGSDVVATLSGAFAALPTPDNNANAILRNRVAGGSPYFDSTDQPSGTSVNLNDYEFVPLNSFPDFGTSSTIINATATAGLNTSVFINVNRVALPPSYTAGTSFTGSLTWAGSSFASLQLTPGSYSGALSNAETLTINVVPEPSTSALAFAGVGCCAALTARRARRRLRSVRSTDG
jgi:hypothetical protein